MHGQWLQIFNPPEHQARLYAKLVLLVVAGLHATCAGAVLICDNGCPACH